MVQLGHDEEKEPTHGMYGTLHAELEVQRTIKRAELPAFLCLLRKAVGPTMVHVDNKGIFDALCRGFMKCTGSKAKDADLWILIWEELHRVHQNGTLVDVVHVKANRSKKEMKQMSLFERFITASGDDALDLRVVGQVAHGVLKVLTPCHSTSKLRRQRKNFNSNILKMSDEILFRSITIKAASTVMKERISKDADFLMQNRKEVPVTRTSGSHPDCRNLVSPEPNFVSRQRSFQKN